MEQRKFDIQTLKRLEKVWMSHHSFLKSCYSNDQCEFFVDLDDLRARLDQFNDIHKRLISYLHSFGLTCNAKVRMYEEIIEKVGLIWKPPKFSKLLEKMELSEISEDKTSITQFNAEMLTKAKLPNVDEDPSPISAIVYDDDKCMSQFCSDLKLSEVPENDIFAWHNFCTMFETMNKLYDWSEQEKMLQLLSAMPSNIKLKISNKPFTEALEFVKRHFESTEALVKSFRQLFDNLSPIINSTDIENIKDLHKLLDQVAVLTKDEKAQKETLKIAVRFMPLNMYLAFVDTSDVLDISTLSRFLKKRISALKLLDIF